MHHCHYLSHSYKISTHEYLSCIDAIIQHSQLQLYVLHSKINVHSFKHSFNMFVIFINKKYSCRSKNGQDHLSYDELVPQPTTSLQRSTQP